MVNKCVAYGCRTGYEEKDATTGKIVCIMPPGVKTQCTNFPPTLNCATNGSGSTYGKVHTEILHHVRSLLLLLHSSQRNSTFRKLLQRKIVSFFLKHKCWQSDSFSKEDSKQKFDVIIGPGSCSKYLLYVYFYFLKTEYWKWEELWGQKIFW